MAKLTYAAITSLDGYIEDEGGGFEWAVPDAEVLALDKVVYSRTLGAVGTPRTGLEREFDPEAVRRMKEVADHDLSNGGPDLAQYAFKPVWWTRSICSCSRSWWAAASRGFPGESEWN